jgi:hypothetical protein
MWQVAVASRPGLSFGGLGLRLLPEAAEAESMIDRFSGQVTNQHGLLRKNCKDSLHRVWPRPPLLGSAALLPLPSFSLRGSRCSGEPAQRLAGQP